MEKINCDFEDQFTYKPYNSSFNKKDKIGLNLLIKIIIAIVLIILSVCLSHKKHPIKKYIIISTSIIILYLVYTMYNNPQYILYTPSSILSMTTSTPEFLDKSKYFPKYTYFEDTDNFKIIKGEVENLLLNTNKGNDIILTRDTFSGQNKSIGSDVKVNKNTGKVNAWRFYTIKLGKYVSKQACEYFPTLLSILNRIPEVKSCGVSILEPNIKIPMHVGYYKGVVRYMLPIIVPRDKENVFLCVNGIKYQWTEGIGVVWDDTYPHKVYNNTKDIRVVIYMDIERKLENIFSTMLNKMFLNIATNSSTVRDEIKRNEVHTLIS